MNERILIVDDDLDMCQMLQAELQDRGYAAEWCCTASEALQRAAKNSYGMVVTDVRMPEMDGITLCKLLSEQLPMAPVVVMTAFGSIETAVAAMRAGAYDFVTKPVDLDLLTLVVKRALQHRRLREEVLSLSDAIADARPFDDMIGSSPCMHRLFQEIRRVADSDASVLITGETGVGKELAAVALHNNSRRKDGPFVALNCAALPEALMESELFGHRKGAFTGAAESRKGLFLKAQGGTLYLDEIAEMPPVLQAKLLRVMEERRVRPVGSDTELALDVRIIAATNKDLSAAVHEDAFRADLYFRINVVNIEVPPLRARANDILLLAQQFIHTFAARDHKAVKGLSAPAAQKLQAYTWPGNVRELRNAMERAVALTAHEVVDVQDLPDVVRSHSLPPRIAGEEAVEDMRPMDQVERDYVLRVLQRTQGNKAEAARILGFDRKTLYRKLEKYGLA